MRAGAMGIHDMGAYHKARTGPLLGATALMALLLCVSPSSSAGVTEPPAPDAAAAPSRERAAGFLQALRQRLQAGLAEGPTAAIAVCQDEAPRIAARWSTDGHVVRRTGPRVRVPAHAPTELDRQTMERFTRRLAAGEPAAKVEEFGVGPAGETRYARALVMEPACLLCHGETLAPAIAAAVAERYPEDRATGYRLGELRGIVVVESAARGR